MRFALGALLLGGAAAIGTLTGLGEAWWYAVPRNVTLGLAVTLVSICMKDWEWGVAPTTLQLLVRSPRIACASFCVAFVAVIPTLAVIAAAFNAGVARGWWPE